MKLLYTDIQYNLTEILTKEAQLAAEAGKRVFYIAPNSLSFEKERSVLERLPQQASFAITVTRFAQMARYFVLNEINQGDTIDDNGLAMIFYRALSSFSDQELRVFGHLRQDPHFIKQLVDLYKELKTANMAVSDLTALNTAEKEEDLLAIFSKAQTLLNDGHFDSQSKMAFFAEQIQSGHLDAALENLVVIVDGFTRFSAEEESLITLLHEKGVDIIIAAYISQKAYHSTFSSGNIYQASLDFIRGLARKFQVKPEYRSSHQESQPAFTALSQLFESRHDFSDSQQVLTDEDKKHFAVWDVINQKEEVEYLAKSIRQKLYEGYRYKDILVLLGDVESYQLQIGKIFDKYEIPYYFGKAESMASHPLVHFIDSLERVKRYRFRAEDVINLLKSGLYGKVSQNQLDKFEQYLIYADIKGQSKFFKDFTLNNHGQFNLKSLNKLRFELMLPLQQLMKAGPQKGDSLLKKLTAFLEAVSLPANFSALSKDAKETEQEKQEQVWKTFTGILDQFHRIFGQQSLSLDEFLALLRSGMMAADYRLVPASVDVVNVKSYDLIEPHTNKFVFALGMTQSHFPKIAQNKSLISDEERIKINETTAENRYFDIIAKENLKKNHFTALSLFNAATQELVLTLPQILNETEDSRSPYILELQEMGVPIFEKGRSYSAASPEDIGHYKALLSRVVELNRSAIEQDLSKNEQTFWSVAVRYLRKKLAAEGITIPDINDNIQTKAIAPQVMAARFPADQPLNLSSSALTAFYNNQYLYFLQYILGLQEMEMLRPDARNHGTYLHRVFELVMQNQSDADFDGKLDRAIQITNQEDRFWSAYSADAESRYTLGVLEDIARSTAAILKDKSSIQVTSEETAFDLLLERTIKIKGVIDRIDRLSDGSLGIVDYKSSKTTFDLQKFYNGLSPQLVTYIEALRANKNADETGKIFGAMYLHMQEPKIDLASVKSIEKIPESARKELRYKGLFLENEKGYLAGGQYHLSDSVYSQEEMDLLLDYNQILYEQAAQQIRKGRFLINPYSQDGKSVQGEQLKAITHFEADRHMSHARRLCQLPRGEKRQGFLELMQKKKEEEDNGL
ncbi:ATP-dependent nuclease subunit B [Streptococcus macacae]|uniref:ATP-dependent helicase/deoxyribonuclease subunit B n=1 Tax=Streptococcus macacae NCTC 11558 TaxID=764298 RepID=G5JWG6_9STRE|nr:ATP-dependent nuclease subunit B [Streptococcus macacae]EHJ52382.1 ATP-dependent nuclease subunit B [Streptococcus macacae NCTC 11558]SUN78746.1 ATP-dependent nuclease subunit B [Streptococcus macacae NCTC 11558]